MLALASRDARIALDYMSDQSHHLTAWTVVVGTLSKLSLVILECCPRIVLKIRRWRVVLDNLTCGAGMEWACLLPTLCDLIGPGDGIIQACSGSHSARPFPLMRECSCCTSVFKSKHANKQKTVRNIEKSDTCYNLKWYNPCGCCRRLPSVEKSITFFTVAVYVDQDCVTEIVAIRKKFHGARGGGEKRHLRANWHPGNVGRGFGYLIINIFF